MFSRKTAIILILVWSLKPSVLHGQMVEERQREKVGSDAPQVIRGDGEALSRLEKLIVQRTNAFRQEQERQQLTVNPQLTKTAQYFADYLARTNEFGHTADGKRPADRAEKFGYDYCLIAENLAYQYSPRGFETEELAERFVQGWRDSPEHRKSMLDPGVTEIGVAVVQSEDTGYYYAVQMFGRPEADSIRFQIDNQAGTEVEYRIGEHFYTLPPRYIRTHERCRPEELILLRLDDKKQTPAETLEPRTGDRLILTRDQNGQLEVRRESLPDSGATIPGRK